MLKYNNLISVIVICLIFNSCKKDENLLTGIDEIDRNYKFVNKGFVEFDKDSLYPFVEIYYQENTTIEDSVYMIATKKVNDYKIRVRGWQHNGRLGDWYHEKVYKDNRIIVDSIVNFVIYCDKNLINTIKKFKDNKLDRSQGYFYEVDVNNKLTVNDTLDIKINFEQDTNVFKEAGDEFYLFLPLPSNDYCNASKYVIDSFPINNNSTRMTFIITEKTGKDKFLGYYYLINKIQNSDTIIKASQVFVEIDFEVK